jgi:hypothetical protein
LGAKSTIENDAVRAHLEEDSYITDGNKAHAKKWNAPLKGGFPNKIN